MAPLVSSKTGEGSDEWSGFSPRASVVAAFPRDRKLSSASHASIQCEPALEHERSGGSGECVRTEWNGGVPFMALIGRNGELLYSSHGQIDMLDVRRVILKNLTDDRYIGQHAYWNRVF